MNKKKFIILLVIMYTILLLPSSPKKKQKEFNNYNSLNEEQQKEHMESLDNNIEENLDESMANEDKDLNKSEDIIDTMKEETINKHIPEENEVYIEVYKKERILLLYKGNELVGEYEIGLGFTPEGHKEKEGDGKTPEGEYYVCVKNPNSNFYLSLGLSYPNIEDATTGFYNGIITSEQYEEIKRGINSKRIPNWYTPLGGEIMIHGHGSHRDWTAGCVAVNDNVMDILWQYCEEGVKVFINP